MSLMVALFGLLKRRANHRINTVISKERGGTSSDDETHIHMSGDCGWLDHASWRVTGSDRTDDESLRPVRFYSFGGFSGYRYDTVRIQRGRYGTYCCPTRAASLSFKFEFVVFERHGILVTTRMDR